MGVSASGIRYPEPGEPVNQGAQAMHNLADDVDARNPGMLVDGTVSGPTLPAGGGTLGAASGLNLAAAPYARLVHVRFKYTLGTTALTAFVLFTMYNGATVLASARTLVNLTTLYLDCWDEVPANATRAYTVNVNSAGPCTLYNSASGFSSFQAVVYGPNRGRIT